MNLLDTLAAASAAAVAAAAYWLFRPLPKEADNPDSLGAYAWGWGYTDGKLYCPKCTHAVKELGLTYCECAEYPIGHYHYQCKLCQFACIMRTHNKDPL